MAGACLPDCEDARLELRGCNVVDSCWRVKIKMWQVLLPVVGLFLVKASIVALIVFAVVHFVRKFW